jgi:hypothetical protein
MADDLDRLELTPWRGGTRLRLRVKPGARRAAVLGVHAGSLRLAVAEPPERGKANRGVLRALAGLLGIAPGEAELTAGAASQDKVVWLPLQPEEVRARLRAAF